MAVTRFNLLFLALIFTSFSCKEKDDNNDIILEGNPSFDIIVAGDLANSPMQEVSGIAPSFKYPEFYWVHNDSGDSAKVYLIDTAARIRAIVVLAGATNRDWESISTYKDDSGKNFILIGDIGDNNKEYAYKQIYKFEEPEIGEGYNHKIKVEEFDRLTFTYHDRKMDAETLMFDPITKEIFIVSKLDPLTTLYSIPASAQWNDTISLKKETGLNILGAVDGNISPNGTEVIIKSYDKVFYWKRSSSIVETLQQKPFLIPYQQEAQGEAVCFNLNNSDFLTTTECLPDKSCKIHYYKRH